MLHHEDYSHTTSHECCHVTVAAWPMLQQRFQNRLPAAPVTVADDIDLPQGASDVVHGFDWQGWWWAWTMASRSGKSSGMNRRRRHHLWVRLLRHHRLLELHS